APCGKGRASRAMLPPSHGIGPTGDPVPPPNRPPAAPGSVGVEVAVEQAPAQQCQRLVDPEPQAIADTVAPPNVAGQKQFDRYAATTKPQGDPAMAKQRLQLCGHPDGFTNRIADLGRRRTAGGDALRWHPWRDASCRRSSIRAGRGRSNRLPGRSPTWATSCAPNSPRPPPLPPPPPPS